MAVIEPDTAFWALVRREKLAELALGGELAEAYRKKAAAVRRGDADAAVRPEAVGRLFQSRPSAATSTAPIATSPRRCAAAASTCPRDELLRGPGDR